MRVVLAGGSGPGTEALAAALAGSPAVSACEVVTGPGGPEPPGASVPEVLVYAAACRGRWAADALPDPEDARRILGAAAERGVRRVVVLSSAAVHEPSHHHPGMIREERSGPAALPARHGNAVSAAWRELEVAARELVTPPAVLTVLRPAPVVIAGGRDLVCRRLERGTLRLPGGPWVATVAGFDPPLQLLAPEDLAAAVRRAVEAERPGVFHVAPRAVVPLHRAVAAAGGRRVPVPRWVQRTAARLGPGPAEDRALRADAVDFLRHPWTVSGETARRVLELAPRCSSAEAAAGLRNAHRAPAPGGERGGTGPGDGPPGDPDEFGLDPAYVERWSRRLFSRVHDHYWRVELAGLEHLPREGPAVLVGIHRGFMPFDGVMTLHAVLRETGRIPRFLIHPSLVKFPVLAPFMRRLGGVYASRDNGERILRRGGLLGVYAEGIRGAFTPYRRAYRLGSFGRYEFLRMALACRAPVIPFVTVGSAEIFPILGRLDWRWFRRWSEWPYLPLTPTFPWLPVPLPSKWHTRFLEPVPVHGLYPPEAAEDPEVVRSLGRELRRRMRRAMEEILQRRPSIFHGDVFGPGDRTP
ncbi:MAG: 1-acyl-sn-glycerol-3-phosphate acyltransferase [Thermoanaerobaculia bacterium]